MSEGDSSASAQNAPKKSDRTAVWVVIAVAVALVVLVALNMN